MMIGYCFLIVFLLATVPDSTTANLGIATLNLWPEFLPNGCAWDFTLLQCRDVLNLNLCKGRCANFGTSTISDCRCAQFPG
jgi:hypothetical protein